MREYLLELIRKYSLLAKCYSNITRFYCNLALKTRNSYSVLTLLCNAQRRIPDLNSTIKCSNLIEYIIHDNCCSNGILLPIEQNNLLADFYRSSLFTEARRVFASEPEIDRLHLRHYRKDSIPARQGNMIILKKPVRETGEKGVLVLKYSPTFEQFPTIYNLVTISKEFRFVFEPSSYRNIEASIFLYSGQGQINILQAAQNDDKLVLERITSSLITVDLGSGDWVDSQAFKQISNEKIYDIVMVASWLKLKRHEVLFQSLHTLKNKGIQLKVALIGYPMDMTKNDIINMAKKYDVNDYCEVFEQIPSDEVARIVSASRVAVHLSKAEGTNKASYEALMCDVPLIVYKHNVGFRNSYINNSTGLLADDHELPGAIEYILKNQYKFSPREWIIQYSGYINATNKLNHALKEVALKSGEPWTIDIVPKKNGPNLIYANEEDRIIMEQAYVELKKHLLV